MPHIKFIFMFIGTYTLGLAWLAQNDVRVKRRIKLLLLFLGAYSLALVLLAQNDTVVIRRRSSSAPVTVTLVAHKLAQSTSTPTTAAVNSTGGNFIVAAVSAYTSGPANSFQDQHDSCNYPCNTWTALTTYSTSGGSNRITLYYVANASVGTSHVFKNVGTSNYSAIAIAVFSGVKTSTPFESGTDVGANNVGLNTVTLTISCFDVVLVMK